MAKPKLAGVPSHSVRMKMLFSHLRDRFSDWDALAARVDSEQGMEFWDLVYYLCNLTRAQQESVAIALLELRKGQSAYEAERTELRLAVLWLSLVERVATKEMAIRHLRPQAAE